MAWKFLAFSIMNAVLHGTSDWKSQTQLAATDSIQRKAWNIWTSRTATYLQFSNWVRDFDWGLNLSSGHNWVTSKCKDTKNVENRHNMEHKKIILVMIMYLYFTKEIFMISRLKVLPGRRVRHKLHFEHLNLWTETNWNEWLIAL